MSVNPITQICTVDSISDVGTHSSFDNEKATDSTYDTLTEANVLSGTTNLGVSSGSGSSYATITANKFQAQRITPANSGTIGTVTVYLKSSSGSINCKAVITDASGNILTNGISSATAVTTTAGNFSFTFATPPSVLGSTNYYVLIIAASTSIYMYYNSTNGGTSGSGTNSYTSPTTPASITTGTYTWRYFIAVLTNKDFQLMLEEQFTSVQIGSFTKWFLQVATGAFSGGENLLLDYWNGSSWNAIAASLTASTTNIFDVTAQVAATFTLRFRDQTHGDTSQNTWQIDSVFLIGANSVSASGTIGVAQSGASAVTALSSVPASGNIHGTYAGVSVAAPLISVPVSKTIRGAYSCGETINALAQITSSGSIGIAQSASGSFNELASVSVSGSIGLSSNGLVASTALASISASVSISVQNNGLTTALISLISVPASVVIGVQNVGSTVIVKIIILAINAYGTIGLAYLSSSSINALTSVPISLTVSVQQNASAKAITPITYVYVVLKSSGGNVALPSDGAKVALKVDSPKTVLKPGKSNVSLKSDGDRINLRRD